MKKVYEKPRFELLELIEKFGVMQGDGSVGEITGGNAMGKENDLTWNDEVEDLWGDDSEEGK